MKGASDMTENKKAVSVLYEVWYTDTGGNYHRILVSASACVAKILRFLTDNGICLYGTGYIKA